MYGVKVTCRIQGRRYMAGGRECPTPAVIDDRSQNRKKLEVSVGRKPSRQSKVAKAYKGHCGKSVARLVPKLRGCRGRVHSGKRIQPPARQR